MSSQLLPTGIRLGDGLGDFIRFTTDEPSDGATGSRSGSGDRNEDGNGAANRGNGLSRGSNTVSGKRSAGKH